MLKSIIETKKEKPTFQIFFLKNEDEGVEVIEVEEIDLEEVKRRVEHGESIFITRKQESKTPESRFTSKIEKESWYLSRA